MSRKYYDCGVPLDHCTGFKPIVGGKYKDRGYKCHGSLEQARECGLTYAESVGYEPPKWQQIKTGKEGRANVPAIRG